MKIVFGIFIFVLLLTLFAYFPMFILGLALGIFTIWAGFPVLGAIIIIIGVISNIGYWSDVFGSAVNPRSSGTSSTDPYTDFADDDGEVFSDDLNDPNHSDIIEAFSFFHYIDDEEERKGNK